MVGVVPQGMHQHRIDCQTEAAVACSVWRELFEELFDGREVAGEDPHLDPLWFLREHPGMSWFARNDGFELICTGLGFDALAGTYDPTFLLVVYDDGFFSRFRSQMRTNWEFALENTRSPFVGTDQLQHLESLIAARDWAGSSLYSFARALAVLRKLRPGCLPDEFGDL